LVQVAVYDAFTDRGVPVFNSIAPTGTIKPYIVMGSSPMHERSAFSRGIHYGGILLQGWGRDKLEAAQLFELAHIALDRVEVAPGVSGKLVLTDLFLAEDALSHLAAMQYNWQST